MKNLFTLGVALPDLSGIGGWFQTQGGYAISIILGIFAIVFLCKQQIGKFIMFLLFGGLAFFALTKPELLMNGITGLWGLLF